MNDLYSARNGKLIKSALPPRSLSREDDESYFNNHGIQRGCQPELLLCFFLNSTALHVANRHM